MCGIAGFLTDQPEADDYAHGLAAAMAATLVHRGPDGSGIWQAPGLALAHRRLSIIDLSSAGAQPMASASGRYVISYNGEIYNYLELRQELERGQVQHWRGSSDTEVLLAAVERWGLQSALRRCNGMFALALWDRQERTLHLARDRFGEKPLYYGWIGTRFAFASELKAFEVLPGWSAEIDPEAVALYTRFNYVPAPWSIYRGIRKLPPATLVTLAGRAEPGRLPPAVAYWELDRLAGATRPDVEAAAEELEQRLRSAVGLRLCADVPLGAFLSGGIDSSLVVALMQSQSPRPVRTFSIGFADPAYDEAQYARRVAAHLGTAHTELYLTPEQAQAVIPSLAGIYDEPFADSSQIPTLLVSRMARRDVTVCLSGDGGDEVFGGYNRYTWGDRLWRRLERVPRPLRRGLARTTASFSEGAWNRLFRATGRLLPRRFAVSTPGAKMHKLATVMSATDQRQLYAQVTSFWHGGLPLGPRCAGAGATRVRQDLPQSWLAPLTFARQMMLQDLHAYLPDDVLVKVDRASMAASLEVRVPFLDHTLVEHALQLPDTALIGGGRGKLCLRQLLYRLVPRELLERPKQGFGIPLGAWLRTSLRDWAEDLLDEQRLRDDGWFDAARVRARWQEHLRGGGNAQHDLWSILMFQQWRQQWPVR